jgi:prepilin-type N-terminal cleavage/methylation domain-containing protein
MFINMSERDKRDFTAITRSHAAKMNPSSAGFSLIELLMVLAVISLVMTFAASGISSMFHADQFDESLSTLTGLMDRAREAAVADNRYVWVAFTANPASSSPAAGVGVTILESLDGTDTLNNFTSGTSSSPLAISSANDLRVILPLQHLAGVDIMNAGTVTLSNAPSVTAASIPGSMDLTTSGGATPSTFTRVVEFAPDGEARLATGTWDNWIEFDLQSSISTSSPDKAVARLSTLTGRLTVYRP